MSVSLSESVSEGRPDPTTAAFMRGDDDALRAAYGRHGALVFSFAERRLDHDAAKDVTQEVFVSAWRRRETFDPERGSLAAWLMTIAKSRVLDHLRAMGRHEARIEAVGRLGADGAAEPAESDVERIADRMVVADALSGLAERPRRIIEMAYLDDMPHSEIAEATGVPLGTVKSDIRRGLDRIRAHLGGAR